MAETKKAIITNSIVTLLLCAFYTLMDYANKYAQAWHYTGGDVIYSTGPSYGWPNYLFLVFFFATLVIFFYNAKNQSYYKFVWIHLLAICGWMIAENFILQLNGPKDIFKQTTLFNNSAIIDACLLLLLACALIYFVFPLFYDAANNIYERRTLIKVLGIVVPLILLLVMIGLHIAYLVGYTHIEITNSSRPEYETYEIIYEIMISKSVIFLSSFVAISSMCGIMCFYKISAHIPLIILCLLPIIALTICYIIFYVQTNNSFTIRILFLPPIVSINIFYCLLGVGYSIFLSKR